MEDELSHMFESILATCPLSNLVDTSSTDLMGGKFTFFPNMCHVCRCFGEKAGNLKRCSACNMISYCGKEHQKEDWPSHKGFCQVLCKIKAEWKVDNFFESLKRFTGQEYYGFHEEDHEKKIDKLIEQSMARAIELLQRKLKIHEMEMLRFPRICDVCYESRPELLINCKKCPQVTFCKTHVNDVEHEKECYKFLLASFEAPPSILSTSDNVKLSLQIKTEQKLPSTIVEFLEKHLTKDAVDSYTEDTKILFISAFSNKYSRSLSLIFAIEILDFNLKSLVIHIVGASLDEQIFNDWEIILHYMKRIQSLKLIFIGPELMSNFDAEKLCKSCKKARKMLTVEIKNTVYDKYCNQPSFEKPDMIACFNPGFHAYPDWSKSVELLNKGQCPLLVTTYSEAEGNVDQQIIESQFPDAKCVYNDYNPFASLYYVRQKFGAPLAGSNEFMFVYKDLGEKNHISFE